MKALGEMNIVLQKAKLHVKGFCSFLSQNKNVEL